MTPGKTPVIGITCATLDSAGRAPAYGVGQPYVAAIAQAGGMAILVPPCGTGEVDLVLDRLDGVLLPGGADVDPAQYSALRSEHVKHTDPPRDATELALVRRARERGLPVMGICRGMHLVNVAFGGTLFQDVPSELAGALRHRTPRELGRAHLEHDIDIRDGSWFAEAAGATALKVNSLHHQAVRDVGSGLVVTATSADGVVEGLETEDRQTVAIQCHTEELLDLPWARGVFDRFVNAARN